jgi:hypothetical protein
MRIGGWTLNVFVLALASALPAIAQENPMQQLPYLRIMTRRLDSLAQDSMIRRVSAVATGLQLAGWSGDSGFGRLDDRSLAQVAALMRDVFARVSMGACMAWAADPGPSFPVREIDSSLAERFADVSAAQILGRVRRQPVRTEAASETALLAALLGGARTATPADSQRLRAASEHRSPTDEDYCWYARVAWARLAEIPPSAAAPLIRRMLLLWR